MSEFSVGDKVELIEDYMNHRQGTRGEVVDKQAAMRGDLLRVRTEGTSELAQPDLHAYAFRFKKVNGENNGEVKVGQIRVWVYDGEPDDTKFEIINVDGDDVTYHYVGEDYTHERPMSDFVGGESQVVTEASAEETKPDRVAVPSVHYSDLRVGDTITFTAVTHFVVDRDKEVEPEVVTPALPAVGTRGTALVDGERIPGIIDEDGDFKYLYFDGDYVNDTYRNWSDSLEFEPEV